MNTQKHTLKTLETHFDFSRSKLYKTLKECGIATFKEGRFAYVSDADFETLKTHVKTHVSSEKKRTFKRAFSETHENEGQLNNFLQEQLKIEQEKNKSLQEENKKLIHDVGRWQGRATTLEEQNIKLLEVSTADESNIVEAEIIEPEPEKKAEKIGIFQKIINFRF